MKVSSCKAGFVTETVELRFTITDLQAERIRPRIIALPFKTSYQEEQRGPSLVAVILCPVAQETTIRGILNELGVSISETPSS
jgi:hypothetical protein